MKKLFFEVAHVGANVAVANCGGAMVGDSISKHRRSATSQKGRRNFLGIACFLLVGSSVLFFNSCVSTNKSFQSSPVIARNVTLDPIKADILVNESQKLNGESTLSYVLFFKIGKNKAFADGIQYSTDVAGGFNPMVAFRANIMNPVRSSAAYNALQDTDYDVLVHPTYETKRENYFFIFRRYTVKVSGYGGKYQNFRTEPQKVIILNNGRELVFPDKSDK